MTDQASEALVDTLQQTEAQVSELKAVLSLQLEALRARDATVIADTTEQISQIARSLDRLLSQRVRQSRAIASALSPDPGSGTDTPAIADQVAVIEKRIREHSEETQRLYEDLAFALHFAAKLDADLIQGIWRAGQPEEATVYGRDGTTSQTGPATGMLNSVG